MSGRLSEGARRQAVRCGLELVEVVGGEDEEKGDGGDGDLAEGSYDEGAGALFEEVFEVGAKTYSGEGE